MNATATATATAAAAFDATTATTGATKGASMAAIKGAMPQYFALNVASIIRATTDKSEHVAMLARALTGAALERAQSGNAPAMVGADSALESVKGKATKQRIDNALSHVRAIKARGMSAAPVADYQAFANNTYSQLVALLTPPAPAAKPAKTGPSWKERAERAESAHAALLAYAESLRSMLGAKAPALPVGATLPATVEEPATV